jgi:hypothetical protein
LSVSLKDERPSVPYTNTCTNYTCAKEVRKLVETQNQKKSMPMMEVQPFLSRFATLTMCIGAFSAFATFTQR